MFKKSHPLQSKSEIILRNIVVLAMVVFFTVFLIIPIGIAFAGSFHEWNPLSGTYKFLGLENYKQVFTSKLFAKSMLNTVIFSAVVIVFRVGLGLGIAYAIYSTLIKHKSFFRAVYYMPVVTPMVADRSHQQNIRPRHQLAYESQNCSDCSNHNDHLEGFRICGCYVYGGPVFASGRCYGGSAG